MMAYYVLHQAKRRDPDEFVPTWKFVGEMRAPELGRWIMMSYKCPTRLTDIYQENPRLLERKLIKGKSGAQYYAYRISPMATKKDLVDVKLNQIRMKIINYAKKLTDD